MSNLISARALMGTSLSSLLSLPIGVLILAPSLFLFYRTFSVELIPEMANGAADQD